MLARVSDLSEIPARLAAVRAQIAEAARGASRDPASVRLVAVTKGKPAEAIRAAYAEGQRDFGENYVQELVEKAKELADLTELRWHFIGQLQRNKVKAIVGLVKMVHAVDRAELALEIDKRATSPIEVLLEVNVSGEASKAGCAPSDVDALVAAVRARPSLRLAGLMTIPPDVDDPERVRPFFARLREIARAHDLAELSMGMTHDFPIAIAEGATMVRVGTAIFGARVKPTER